jgi:quinoprotein glucose dehydrogenase
MAPLETGADWPAYGGTYHALRYSPLTEISRENVTEQEQVWEYRTRDIPSEESEGDYAAETTPLKIGDNLFLCSAKTF